MLDYRKTAAPIIREFLTYHEVVCGHSRNTIDAYYSDLRTFLGWLHTQERPHDADADSDESASIELFAALKKSDIFEYLTWLSRDRSLDAATRARRLSAVRSLYRYLVVVTEQIPSDPTAGVTPPKPKKTLPSYLDQEQALLLLDAPDGKHELRDKTILMLFLTCGLRVSELVGLNLNSVRDDLVKVMGKGSKERVVYFSEAMKEQMSEYLETRKMLDPKKGHEQALFLSNRLTRISVRRVQSMVDDKLVSAGLDPSFISPHKLRHTAATLLLKNGVDIRVLQDFLGHERLDTTKIYTHVDSTDLRLAAEASPIKKKS